MCMHMHGCISKSNPPLLHPDSKEKKKLFVVFVRDKQEQLMRGKSQLAE